MKTDYLYSAARVKALETSLLSDVQLERLLSAKTHREAFRTLHDTFLSSFIGDYEKTNLSESLRESLVEAKKTLDEISPVRGALDIFWMRYDFHNAKTIIKARAAGLSPEEAVARCFNLGTVSPADMYDAIDSDRAGSISPALGKAIARAREAKEPQNMDAAMNVGYFAAAADIAAAAGDEFRRRLVVLLIDLFNLRSLLRFFASGERIPEVFAPGGTFSRDAFRGADDVFSGMEKIAPRGFWDAAISHYKETGFFSMIELAADDLVLRFLKEESRDIFCLASLFAYFAARKNNVQVVKAIMVAKKNGLSERDTRKVLRRLYA